MQKKEANPQSNNQEEIKKNEKGEKHPIDMDVIREIIRIIADSSYDGRYSMERHTKSLYRFGFGVFEHGNIPSMFEGKTANEAMCRAISFELTTEFKITSREKLTKLAEDKSATIQDEQQKRKGMEEEIAAKDSKYKESMKERDGLKQEREAISSIINRVTDRWKDDAVMQSFEKEIAAWKKRPSVFIGFILENIEKLMYEKIPYAAPPKKIKKMVEKREEDLLEVKEHPLKKVRILAMVNKDVSILEPLWNDLQDSTMDGKWHAFSEANKIIRRHGYSQVTEGRISQIIQGYLKFAKDEEYHIARGGKDYLFERKRIGYVHKFRFTPLGEEVKPEKPIEKKDKALLEAEERSLRKERVLATVGKNVSILEPLWNDLQDSTMDGKWHAFSEANEIIMRHGYSQITVGRILQIRQGYFKFAKDEEYHTARGGKDYLYEWKRTDGVNKFRFTTVGEKVKPGKTVGMGLELGKKVDYISEHPIYENPLNEFIRLFCDGKWHSASEPVELFKKYDRYNRFKQSSLSPLRSAYLRHVEKSYQMTKKREGKTYKFKSGKKWNKTELAKIKEGKTKKSSNNVKCARCGQAIRYDEECHQVDNLFYHPDCYKIAAP